MRGYQVTVQDFIPAIFAALASWGAMHVEMRWLRRDMDARIIKEAFIQKQIEDIHIQIATRPCLIKVGGKRKYDLPADDCG